MGRKQSVSSPLELVCELLISFNLADGLGGIVSLRMISPLVVDQHFDQLVVHDLHVHL